MFLFQVYRSVLHTWCGHSYFFEVSSPRVTPSGPAFSVYGQNKPSMTPFGQPLAGPGITNNPFMVSTVQPLVFYSGYCSTNGCILPSVYSQAQKRPWIESLCGALKRRQPRGRLRGREGGNGPGDITHC